MPLARVSLLSSGRFPYIICYFALYCTILVCSKSNGTQPVGTTDSTDEVRRDQENLRVVYESVRMPCYSDGQANECTPPFTNVAEGAQVQVTSVCKSGEKICLPGVGVGQHQCHLCDPSGGHGPAVLTDRHLMNNETYWISDGVLPGEAVNVTISLNKRFEVYYISLQPYGVLPDSIALYKSTDFGKSWHAWQYFSTDCYRAFRLPTSNVHNAQISPANIQEVLCVSLKSYAPQDELVGRPMVIAFSTTIGRPSSQPWSPVLIDWMTMTDLRVRLGRFPEDDPLEAGRHDASGLLMTPNLLRLSSTKVFRVADLDHSPSGALGMSRGAYQNDAAHLQKNMTADARPLHFALSDISIGGRCKCNGHANRCVRDRVFSEKPGSKQEWGPLRCDCQHNTGGTDCEYCASGYLDAPWARADQKSANECKRCDCNLHSKECVFSQQIYLMSHKLSGGVCQHCQHNTVGRRCHQCSSGYYRDWTKPASHNYACLECRCHPIGSLPNKPCDRKTGQCPCKPGVTGQACNRCQEGYKQTRLADHPCIRATEHYAYRRRETDVGSNGDGSNSPTSEADCPPCKPDKKRIRFRKFCKHEAIFRGVVVFSKSVGDRVRYEVQIQDTWRVDGAASRLLPKKTSPNLPAYPIWIKNQQQVITDSSGHQTTCTCPELKLHKSYLFLTQSFQVPYGNRMELMLESDGIVLPWQESWRRRLGRFVRRAGRGRCSVFDEGASKSPPETFLRHVQRLRTSPGFYPAGLTNPQKTIMVNNQRPVNKYSNIATQEYGYSLTGRQPEKPKPPEQQQRNRIPKQEHTAYNTYAQSNSNQWNG